MGKKIKLLQWPSCNHPKTLSYRFNSDDVIKTVNSVFFDQNDAVTSAVVDTPESWFTNSSESASFSTESDDFADGESLETVVAGARSERRLFFEPRGPTSAIVAAKTEPSSVPSGEPSRGSSGAGGDHRRLGESVALAMESADPYGDFRRSMAEMVETNGVREWEGLEELLGWYLRMNSKENHGLIVGAFVDLLVEISNSGDSADIIPTKPPPETAEASKAESFSSALSRFSSPNSERGRRSENEIEEERNLIR